MIWSQASLCPPHTSIWVSTRLSGNTTQPRRGSQEFPTSLGGTTIHSSTSSSMRSDPSPSSSHPVIDGVLQHPSPQQPALPLPLWPVPLCLAYTMAVTSHCLAPPTPPSCCQSQLEQPQHSQDVPPQGQKKDAQAFLWTVRALLLSSRTGLQGPCTC